MSTFLSVFAPAPLVLLTWPNGILLLLYCLTTAWAVCDAWRLRFRDYHLTGMRGVVSVACGCLLFPSLLFPLFLLHRHRIRRGTARRRSYPSEPGRNGWLPVVPCLFSLFCIIPLVVVIHDREQQVMAENERLVRESLRHYHAAQEHFRDAGLAAIAGNTRGSTGYCDDFSLLHYGRDGEGKRLGLIRQSFADAVALPDAEDQFRYGWTHQDTGYVFREDPRVTDWNAGFGLFAYPATQYTTGKGVYRIGEDGEVVRYKYVIPEFLHGEYRPPPEKEATGTPPAGDAFPSLPPGEESG